ncbi:uncharacterized protein ACA1_342930 [Acanthamoeba castellanii str. Neff]|uniref:Uncharacterized protein n=1 Tax=Acanthamoeba castellanii (strain ATCC 30010 / Neff) TaxID=1257118 RepID=L8HCB8_ACACF|nr:uncharacterized protein ACA1_342930 [Acanthamoeba castellanii str. Neff]ELR23159.1 hypothetical protein ACA1_342930 [Acanthamoeba castellanii str. Neff]
MRLWERAAYLTRRYFLVLQDAVFVILTAAGDELLLHEQVGIALGSSPILHSHQRYYIAIICTWSFNNVHKGFKDHAYTNNPDGTINDFYHQLFVHQIDFAFDPDKDHILLFQIFSMYYRRRYKQKQMKAEMQRKLAHERKLFSNRPNTKAIAFSINNSPKELIHWHFNKQINHLITFKPSGEILYTRYGDKHMEVVRQL